MKSLKGLLEPGDFIKYEQNKNVALYVTGVDCLEVGGSSIHVMGIWYNQGFEKSWSIGVSAEFTISERKLKNWLLCVDPQKDPCLRKCEWTPLAYE